MHLSATPFFHSIERVHRLQLSIDADGYISQRTTAYLQKLDEFKMISARQRERGMQHSSQASNGSASASAAHSRLAGAQVEESKSQESSPSPNPQICAEDVAAEASKVEQELLQCRAQLLQCMEMKDEIERETANGIHALEELEKAELRSRAGSFTDTHFRILLTLCPPANADQHSSPCASPPPLSLTSSLCTIIDRFLFERSTLRKEKQALLNAYRRVHTIHAMRKQRSVAGMNAMHDDQPAAPNHADASANHTASVSVPAGSSTSPTPSAELLANRTLDTVYNIFQCRLADMR